MSEKTIIPQTFKTSLEDEKLCWPCVILEMLFMVLRFWLPRELILHQEAGGWASTFLLTILAIFMIYNGVAKPSLLFLWGKFSDGGLMQEVNDNQDFNAKTFIFYRLGSTNFRVAWSPGHSKGEEGEEREEGAVDGGLGRFRLGKEICNSVQ